MVYSYNAVHCLINNCKQGGDVGICSIESRWHQRFKRILSTSRSWSCVKCLAIKQRIQASGRRNKTNVPLRYSTEILYDKKKIVSSRLCLINTLLYLSHANANWTSHITICSCKISVRFSVIKKYQICMIHFFDVWAKYKDNNVIKIFNCS